MTLVCHARSVLLKDFCANASSLFVHLHCTDVEEPQHKPNIEMILKISFCDFGRLKYERNGPIECTWTGLCPVREIYSGLA